MRKQYIEKVFWARWNINIPEYGEVCGEVYGEVYREVYGELYIELYGINT